MRRCNNVVFSDDVSQTVELAIISKRGEMCFYLDRLNREGDENLCIMRKSMKSLDN
jgi:hypothetical protein